MIHPLLDPALLALRAIPLAPLCAVAIACQLLAIIAFVERLKGVDQDVANRANKDARQIAARLERQERAAYGLLIDLSLYLLAGEIVAAFVVLTR